MYWGHVGSRPVSCLSFVSYKRLQAINHRSEWCIHSTHTNHSHASGLKCKQVWFCIQASGCKWQAAREGQRYDTWNKCSNAAQAPNNKPENKPSGRKRHTKSKTPRAHNCFNWLFNSKKYLEIPNLCLDLETAHIVPQSCWVADGGCNFIIAPKSCRGLQVQESTVQHSQWVTEFRSICVAAAASLWTSLFRNCEPKQHYMTSTRHLYPEQLPVHLRSNLWFIVSLTGHYNGMEPLTITLLSMWATAAWNCSPFMV